MSRRVALSFVIITLLTVTAYATDGPTFAEEQSIPEGKALVYIYCPKSYFSTPDAAILANAKQVVVLSQGCYFPYMAASGRIDFSTLRFATHLILEAEAGREYFLRVVPRMSRWNLDLIPRDRAMVEIAQCRLSDSLPE